MPPATPAVPPPPTTRSCGAMEVHHRQLEEDPGFRTAQISLEHACQELLRTAPAARTTPYKIPVVVHVLHRVAAEKIGAAQVKAQIKVLNADFRAKNADRTKVPGVWSGLVADAKIQFALATKDPTGKPTTGITFTATNALSFGSDDGVKAAATGGVNPWPTNRYLNIWVCTLRGGLLGYAQFPGGPAATDGVVVRNTAFGTGGTAARPFHLGRTCTHEVGHYLNLRHIWGDTPDCSGSDLVADTPNAEGPNMGKPGFPRISCNNGPNGDMYMNYMDYTDDEAMFMFTPGQVARMTATLDGPRSTLVS